ncbi:MAG: ribosome recycling factor [Sodaliphilus sp.]
MSEKEFKLYIEALDKGLLEAERKMLHEKAERGESCVYQDDNGKIYRVPAKDVIASNPRFK